MKKLISLRHFEIDGCMGLTYMPRGLGALTQLQTLTQFRIGNENDSGECSRSEERKREKENG